MSSGNFLNILPLNWQIFLAALVVVFFLSSRNCQEAAILLIKHYCSYRKGLCIKFSVFGCLAVITDLKRDCSCKLVVQTPRSSVLFELLKEEFREEILMQLLLC